MSISSSTVTDSFINSSTVNVAVRIRPLLGREATHGCGSCIQSDGRTVVCKGRDTAFQYNYVFDGESSQNQIYETSARPLVEKLFAGFNVTILAYGQTGSGKTFTMGTETCSNTATETERWGLIPRVASDIFSLGKLYASQCSVDVRLSFVEIYLHDLQDLLANKQKRMVRFVNNEVRIDFLTERSVRTLDEVMFYLEQGCIARTKGQTLMNAQSSRSHAILTLSLTITDRNDPENVVVSKCRLVDLAGSERMHKAAVVTRPKTLHPKPRKFTDRRSDHAFECININLGLYYLGKVIESLASNRRQGAIGYRDHLLTKMLRDSLGGNAFTLFIACVSPADSNWEETLCTLRYAQKALNIKNLPKVNRSIATAEIGRLRQEVLMLRRRVFELESDFSMPNSKATSFSVLSRGTYTIQGNILNTPNILSTIDCSKSASSSTLHMVPSNPNETTMTEFMKMEHESHQAAKTKCSSQAVATEKQPVTSPENWLSNELSNQAALSEARTLLADLAMQRNELKKQRRAIRERSARFDEIRNAVHVTETIEAITIGREIDARCDRISELEGIVAVGQHEKRWNQIHTVAQAQFVLDRLFDLASEQTLYSNRTEIKTGSGDKRSNVVLPCLAELSPTVAEGKHDRGRTTDY